MFTSVARRYPPISSLFTCPPSRRISPMAGRSPPSPRGDHPPWNRRRPLESPASPSGRTTGQCSQRSDDGIRVRCTNGRCRKCLRSQRIQRRHRGSNRCRRQQHRQGCQNHQAEQTPTAGTSNSTPEPCRSNRAMRSASRDGRSQTPRAVEGCSDCVSTASRRAHCNNISAYATGLGCAVADASASNS